MSRPRATLRLRLRDARAWTKDGVRACDLLIQGGHVIEETAPPAHGEERVVEMGGRLLLPGLVNAHDHLDGSTFPPLGQPPYASASEWAADASAASGQPAVLAALAVPLTDRLFLGGIRNLLAGATAVAHHGPYHRALARPDFPVRVLARYQFAHSVGREEALRKTYRTTDRRIPWMVHAGEGTDERSRGELRRLEEANLLRQNTVLVHAIAFGAAEATRIAGASACVAWCPESNRRLYGATADVAALRAAGVRVGLGSDGPAAGARDALSNLAAARAEGVLDDALLIEMATIVSGAVARMPVGGTTTGGPADFVAVDAMEDCLRGDRRTLALVMVGGRALYGDPAVLEGFGVRGQAVSVEGAPRALEARLAVRLGALLRRHPALRQAGWAAGLSVDPRA